VPLGRFVEINEASQYRILVHGLGKVRFEKKPKTLNLIIMGILLLKIPPVCEKYETDFVFICTLNRSPAAIVFKHGDITARIGSELNIF
jgi:hypothetical protein